MLTRQKKNKKNLKDLKIDKFMQNIITTFEFADEMWLENMF